MKSLYLTTVAVLFSIITNAQIYSNNFDQPLASEFTDGSALFIKNQHASNLVVFSQGHEEWDKVEYIFNDGTTATPISFTTEDTIYIRVKAEYNNTVRPVLEFHFQDANGVIANNDQNNAVNVMTLSNDWQVFSFKVMDVAEIYPNNTGENLNLTSVSKLLIGVNNGFGSQWPKTNADGQTVTTAFNGTIYIDYINVGTDGTAGAEFTTATSLVESFDTDVSENLTVGESFTTSVANGKLSITSEGHDEWHTIRYNIPGQVIDITENPRLSFTATAEKASGYSGPIGVMVVAVDDRGTRIEYPATELKPSAFVLQDLTSESKTYTVSFDSLVYIADISRPVNGRRIAYLDILINPGFNSFPLTNDASVLVNDAFEGVIHIEEIRLGSAVSGLSNARVETLAFYPNPAQNHVILEGKFSGAAYEIYNTAGLTMKSGRVQNQISVGELENGLYIMVVTNTNGQRYTSQFVKE